jgi:nucleotide-binding universal stress UspA family protein
MPPKTILCSIDLSPFSKSVLHHGFGLASRFGARLIVFHAVYAAEDPVYATPLFERGGQQRAKGSAAREQIRILMETCPVPWEPDIRAGEPVAALVEAAAEAGAELVIAASHGLGGLKRLLLGRVVERMARTLARPLLVVRGRAHREAGATQSAAPPALERILVGCRQSSGAQPVLEWGWLLASAYGGRLTALHTLEAPPPEDPVGDDEVTYTQSELKQKQVLRDRIKRNIPSLDAFGGRVEIVLGQGLPAEELLAYSQSETSSVMVVGARRQSGLRRVLIGSTTEAVLRHAPCPVLIVPE